MHALLIAGAALVGLPILLHLIMKQEPKRLTFPAFRFLKQKLKTNQRKLRLRHFILLALRMLLIALFCLTLYQPTVKSDRLNIRGEQPIAVVIVIDTTPSMGYVAGNESRLDEARRRALELLKELPDKSPVAVIDTADPTGGWLPVGDRDAARKAVEALKDTKGGQPVSAGIARAYQLFMTVDRDTDATDPLPKLVVVFTDRTVAAWDAGRTEDLKKLRDLVPEPHPVHVVVDFGADAPANVALLGVEMKPQVIGTNQPAVVDVTVSATGSDRPLDVSVLAKLVGAPKGENKSVTVAPGQSRQVRFEFRDLKPGLHQVEFALAAPDKLAFDNTRFLTFKVGESRRILTITDDIEGAGFWQAAHGAKREFDCLVVSPDQIEAGDNGTVLVRYAPDPKKPNETVTDDLRTFEVLCLLSVNNPQAMNPARPNDGPLWDRLRPVLRAGGKLIVIPGTDTATVLDGYNVAADLMPGKLKKDIVETRKLKDLPPQPAASWPAPRDGKNGVIWALDDNAFKHPMLKIVDDWRQQKAANLDVVANPRTTKKYWDVEPITGGPAPAGVIVSYLDAAAAKDRRPAVLERAVLDKDGKAAKGKVVLLTTRMDIMPNDDLWHDYWQEESTWYLVFPYLLARYLAGDTADANFNYATGATVAVPLPRGRLDRDSVIVLDGPGVGMDESKPKVGAQQTELRLGPPRTGTPGNYLLSVKKDGAFVWRDGFSTNVPPEESNLEKVSIEEIEKLTGPGRVFPIDRNSTLRDWLDVALGQPVDLFPWLLIAVLMLFVLEGLAANRFYRRPKA
jgi:hypothetical protein